MKLKFKIGDKVSYDGGSGKVLGVLFDGKNLLYKVSSKEVDIEVKEIVEGVKFLSEDQLKKE